MDIMIATIWKRSWEIAVFSFEGGSRQNCHLLLFLSHLLCCQKKENVCGNISCINKNVFFRFLEFQPRIHEWIISFSSIVYIHGFYLLNKFSPSTGLIWPIGDRYAFIISVKRLPIGRTIIRCSQKITLYWNNMKRARVHTKTITDFFNKKSKSRG